MGKRDIGLADNHGKKTQIKRGLSIPMHTYNPYILCSMFSKLHSVGSADVHWKYSTLSYSVLFTPHAQRERGKVIGRGVHIYIYIYMSVVEKKFESYFRDRLTFSNVDSRASR